MKHITIDEAIKRGYFSKTMSVNCHLTNHCSRNCRYCFEQHDTDYSEWTVEKLKKVFDFIGKINPGIVKTFQYFGGEPLIKKDLIYDFINTYRSEIESRQDITQFIVTNGDLLDKEFIDFWYNIKTDKSMLISCDTFDPSNDHREATKEKIEHIQEMIKYVPEDYRLKGRLGIRITISQETLPHLREYLLDLYNNYQIRFIIVHPLTYSRTQSFIEWSEENWKKLIDIITEITSLPDLWMEFVEGVGTKYDNNCLVGGSMFAIDAEGTFSGCYFFTNLKANLPESVIMGNLFKDEYYYENHEYYLAEYKKFLDSDPMCKDCHIKESCYQCPAGNLGVFGTPYHSDSMCKRLTEMHLQIKKAANERRLETSIVGLCDIYTKDDSEIRKRFIKLFYKIAYNRLIDTENVDPKYIDTNIPLYVYLNVLKDIITYVEQNPGSIYPIDYKLHNFDPLQDVDQVSTWLIDRFKNEFCNVNIDMSNKLMLHMLAFLFTHLHYIPMTFVRGKESVDMVISK